MKIIKSVTPVLAGARLFIWAVIKTGSRDPPAGGERNPPYFYP